MDFNTLQALSSWQWPDNADTLILGVLRNRQISLSDRLSAAEMAGDPVAMNDDLASALLDILTSGAEPEVLRGKAAISLGPILELAYIDDFEDPEEIPISEETFTRIQKTFNKIYSDPDIPKEIRRRTLEASVRAPQKWQEKAIREAYSKEDEEWKLTAVFCMRFIRGFNAEIIESLNSKNPDIFYEAVSAAGNWEISKAWPLIERLLTSPTTEKPLLLAAIEAAPLVRPRQAIKILNRLLESDDEDIVIAVQEALIMAGDE